MLASKSRACLFIDASNLHYPLREEGWRIDWKRFLAHFQGQYTLCQTYYYEGILGRCAYFDKHPGATFEDFLKVRKRHNAFLKKLRTFNITVRTKPVGRLYSKSAGKIVHKCNFDVELTIDVIDQLDRYDVCLLVSGDGDFGRLVRYLKGKWKKVVIIAHGKNLAK